MLFKNADSGLGYIYLYLYFILTHDRPRLSITMDNMFTDRQTTPSKGLPGTPTTTEHTHAVPISNPYIPLSLTISSLSSTQDILLTLSPLHSSVVAKYERIRLPHNQSPNTHVANQNQPFAHHLPNPPTETRDTLNLRRSTRIRAQSQPRF